MTTMDLTTDALEMVVLRDGPVRLAALRLLWDLEDRGFAIAVVDGGLRVRPRSQITAADDAAIRQHRDELIALIQSCGRIQ